MESKRAKRAYLVLADGTVFHGYPMGAVGETVGEVVFNTCTASYQSLLSDPTYYGQIVAQTYPLVGNRGVEEDAASSNIMANGYIAREWCNTPSAMNGGVTLDEYLRKRNIVGICGIDTRRLTRALRDKGYFNGAITDSLNDFDALLHRIKAYTISGAVEAVTIQEPEHIPAENPLYRVTVIDCGFPRSMLGALTRRGCELTLVPGWYFPLCHDGAPATFTRYDFSGGTITERRSVNFSDSDEQYCRVYNSGLKNAEGRPVVRLNVWDWHPTWKFECRENGAAVPASQLKAVREYDDYYVTVHDACGNAESRRCFDRYGIHRCSQ